MSTLPILDPKELESRLVSIAGDIANVVAHKKNVDYNGSFEAASNIFGLPYGISKLFEKVQRHIALSINGQAQVKGESFVDTLDDIIGYSLLFKDFISRNPHLVSNGHLNVTPTEIQDAVETVTSTPLTLVQHEGESELQKIESAVSHVAHEVVSGIKEAASSILPDFTPDIPATSGDQAQDAR